MNITSIRKLVLHRAIGGVHYECVIDGEDVSVWADESLGIGVSDETYQKVKEKIGDGDVWPT
tara:strand:- start:306 stop:491 length:186 start_codon:yes stop_codon:yes gene_type:complete